MQNFALHQREKCRDSKDANATLLLFTYCQQRDIKYREIIGKPCMFLNSWNHQQFLTIKLTYNNEVALNISHTLVIFH